VLDVVDEFVLMAEPVVHFFLHVAPLLLELGACPRLEGLDPVVLPLYLVGDPLVQLRLPGEPLVLLDSERLLDLGALLV